jgi:hypothetical protein
LLSFKVHQLRLGEVLPLMSKLNSQQVGVLERTFSGIGAAVAWSNGDLLERGVSLFP